MRDGQRIITASNRAPVSFVSEEGAIVQRRGGGGLVTALTGALYRAGGMWIAAAASDEDRRLARRGAIDVVVDDTRFALRFLDIDPRIYAGYYNDISNRVLWFVHHYLWDIPRSPAFGDSLRRNWAAYQQVNRAFADALVEESATSKGDSVHLVQDYHLALAPQLIRARLPHARVSYFSHIPFAGSTYIRILPTWMREEILAGLLGADIVGFQAEHWADNFLLACRTLPGARVNLRRRLVRWDGREVLVRIYPVTIDTDELVAAAAAPGVERERDRLASTLRGRRLIVRADRAELSKNILRGFIAYEGFLKRNPRWRRRVVMLAFLDPSREEVPEYRSYVRECLAAAKRINREMGEGTWQPISVKVGADRSVLLAAYSLYDVLLVNPVFDGMNLVAKEGPTLNRQGGVLVLSQNAGAFDELGRFALAINPFDVGQTADALATALAMGDDERARRARGLRGLLARSGLDAWVDAQLRDLDARARV